MGQLHEHTRTATTSACASNSPCNMWIRVRMYFVIFRCQRPHNRPKEPLSSHVAVLALIRLTPKPFGGSGRCGSEVKQRRSTESILPFTSIVGIFNTALPVSSGGNRLANKMSFEMQQARIERLVPATPYQGLIYSKDSL